MLVVLFIKLFAYNGNRMDVCLSKDGVDMCLGKLVFFINSGMD